MSFLGLRAYLNLIYFDFLLARGNFASLYQKVRSCPVAMSSSHPDVTEKVCAAVNIACIWYWKEVLCLQRSAVTACLLKRYGIRAQMTIGAQQMPFRAHAWVEVNGSVVNDRPHLREVYAVLDQC
ncbi:MAG: lasso peptide biosynthesis B2 protein [Candidatus Sulfotelmatobacter sp.]|jgi:hypothetical protein|nr:lasso peptide biosynthesis B2 protein [Terriglobales bacterium]